MYSDYFEQDAATVDALLASESRLDAALDRIAASERPTLEDAASILRLKTCEHYERVMAAAAAVTCRHHRDGIGMIAPLYFSDICWNDCACCDMSFQNKSLRRKTLTFDEYVSEFNTIKTLGYNTIEIVGGGFPLRSKVGDRFLQFIDHGRRNIQNFAFFVDSFNPDEYRAFASDDVVMIHWQETYDRTSYGKMVKAGPKTGFDKRLNAHDAWIRAGGKKVGLSVLAGVADDFRRDVLLLLSHALYLERTHGIAPSCFGTVRIQPIKRKDVAEFTQVHDDLMYLATTLYRLMFPEANIIVTSRERPEVVANQLKAGGSFANSYCTTVVGGYGQKKHLIPEECGEQFAHGSPTPEAVETMIRGLGKVLNWSKPL